jgi:hypothetical protein
LEASTSGNKDGDNLTLSMRTTGKAALKIA